MVLITVKLPGGRLHRRSASAIWRAEKPAVVTPAAYYSQQAALQFARMSPAPAIAYFPYVVPTAPAIAMWSSTISFGSPRATSSKRPAPPKKPALKRPAAATPTAPPPAKSMRPYSNPYTVFCQEQRPVLPEGLRNSVREQTLGQMWRELSKPEQAKYKVGGSEPPAPAPAPASVSAPAPAPSPAPAPAPPSPIAPAPSSVPSPTVLTIPNPLTTSTTTGLELLSTAALSVACCV
eukprot:scaffold112715_cov63-Phaeocystis_antarctica.AAC.1